MKVSFAALNYNGANYCTMRGGKIKNSAIISPDILSAKNSRLKETTLELGFYWAAFIAVCAALMKAKII